MSTHPAPPAGEDRERSVELAIGRMLRAGVVAAAIVTALGGLLLLAHHGGAPADFAVFRGETAPFRGVSAIFAGVAAGESAAIVQLGLLLLIATPIMRVALSLLAFARLKDWTYVVLSAIVLAVLLFGLSGAALG